MARNEVPYIRPGYPMTHVVDPILHRRGMTPLLTVPGRVRGVPHPMPLGKPFEHAGARFLVSGRGETRWVRDLRAARGGRLHFRIEPADDASGKGHVR